MRLADPLRERWQRDPLSIVVPAVVFAFALFVYTRALGWGLPAGDETWAADALKPSAPISVAWHELASRPNNGWFWFKYPPLHAFLLCALYLPYLAWLTAVGGIMHFQSEYPFGMRDPISSLSTLALIGRAASAVMGAGCAVLIYASVVRSFGRAAAACAAFAATMAYPMVFYSQTTNVEVPYIFWMLLALVAAVRIVEGDAQRRWWMLLGIAGACSVSTKELVAGFLAGLPVAIIAVSIAGRRPVMTWLRGGVVAAAAFAATMVIANAVFWNPLGFWRRIGFLTQTLPRDIALQYAPYYFPIELGGNRGAAVELAQLSTAWTRLVASVGWPVVALAIAGLVLAIRRRPAWTSLLLAAAAAYYVVSVRAMLSMSIRYLMPLALILATMAGIALAELLRPGRLRPLRAAVAAGLAMWIFAYGWDVDRMLAGDGRYAAEHWLAEAASAHPDVEIYQNRAYLPRFPEGLAVHEIDYDQRGIDQFTARRPDLVVVSSSGLSGITVRYKQDWQDDGGTGEGYSPAQTSAGGQVMNYSRDANSDFLRRLTAGELGYEEAARFVVDPWIPRPLIQSLNPEIAIYRRRVASVAPDANAAASSAAQAASAAPTGN